MIIWLSSYPRSGNTLLRTILKRCLDLDSYADEAILVDSPIRSDNSLIGHKELPSPWPEFYSRATASAELFLVKTHLPPRDSRPFIYVVRDGRSAIKSYQKYFENYVQGHRASLYQLIAGDDAYGDWSSHYHAWMSEDRARGMMVRCEELSELSGERLAQMAAFLGHDGPVAPWSNPFSALANLEPGFFREGRKSFTQDPEWPVLADHLFNWLHGPLLRQLGYEVADTPTPPPESCEMFDWALKLVQRNRALQSACDERLALIDRLSVEAQKRLDVIQAMAGSGRAT